MSTAKFWLMTRFEDLSGAQRTHSLFQTSYFLFCADQQATHWDKLELQDGIHTIKRLVSLYLCLRVSPSLLPYRYFHIYICIYISVSVSNFLSPPSLPFVIVCFQTGSFIAGAVSLDSQSSYFDISNAERSGAYPHIQLLHLRSPRQRLCARQHDMSL